MDFDTLDMITMWSAFIYGATLFFVLEVPFVKRVESQRPELFLILRQHQPLAGFCLIVGGLWILQTLWI